jgi:hypothetical protein
MTNNQPDRQEIDLPKLSNPARRALAGAGISRLEQLTTVSEADLKKLHGMGPKGIGELRDALAARGLSFAERRSEPEKG